MANDDMGSTPLERLTSHFENVDMTCPECGFEDEGGEWRSETDGSEVRYRHRCPSCGFVRRRTYTLEE